MMNRKGQKRDVRQSSTRANAGIRKKVQGLETEVGDRGHKIAAL